MEIMTTDEILKSLCYYDKRNPDSDIDDETISDHLEQLLRASKKSGYTKNCSCDNCFYGRTKLAEELLKDGIIVDVGSFDEQLTSKKVKILAKGYYAGNEWENDQQEEATKSGWRTGFTYAMRQVKKRV